jgi:hypothetical protein
MVLRSLFKPHKLQRDAAGALAVITDARSTNIDWFYKLLGSQAVLLPLPLRTKKPGEGWTGWQHTTYEDTQTPSYQSELVAVFERGGNLGVLLGNGLSTVDIDSDQYVDEFLALNPALSDTLRSRGARGCQIWIHPIGEYPKKIFKLKKADGTNFGEWRGAGGQSVIAGVHPESTKEHEICYGREVDKPAIAFPFSDIKWPPDVVLPWIKTQEPQPEPSQNKATAAADKINLQKRITAYLDKIPSSISGKNGDDQLLKAANALIHGFGLDVEEALPFLHIYNQRSEPPWPEKRLLYKLQEALDHPPPGGKPRGYLLGDELLLSLTELYGEPVYLNASGQVSQLGEPFWAALYAHENKVLFDPALNKFYTYNDSSYTWTEQSEHCIRVRIEKRILEASKQWTQYPGLSKHRSSKSISGIISHLRGRVEKWDPFIGPTGAIHLANCTLHVTLEGHLTVPAGPDNFAKSRSQVSYDPAKKDCPKFTEFLSLLDVDDRRILREHAALVLTGDNPIQRILIIDGLAKTGKSTYVTLLGKLLGPDKASTLRTKYLGDRFEIGQLRGKSLLTGPDVDSDFLQVVGASAIKALCGGDNQKGELKGSNETFDVAGRFNIAIAANTRLKIRTQRDEDAWERRLIIIRFERTFPQENRILDIDEVLLREEGSAILNWGLDGLSMLRDDLAESKDIQLSDKQLARIHSLLQESDALRNFLKSEVAIRHRCSLSVDELVTAFTKFSQRQDWAIEPVRSVQKNLEALMMELFGACKSNCVKRRVTDHQTGQERETQVKGYIGVGFRSLEDEN